MWFVLLSVAVFLAILEYSRLVLSPLLLSWRGRILYYAVVLLCLLFFSVAVFKVFEEMQMRLERRNRELLALHEAGLAITAELGLETVLQKVVETARQLVDARYGALAIYREDGTIQSFFTSGLTPEVHQAIGNPPRGRGLLGLVLLKGERLRLPDLAGHAASCGFPPNHPPMKSLLAVPVVGAGPYRGNLYVTEKTGRPAFSEEDEETLVRFATQATIAVANAALHRQARELAAAEERLRIAHEMHDGLAQVLAYVNTKAQAVREYLRAGRGEEAGHHLDQLAAAARDVFGDVREAILGLRSTSAPDKPLAQTLREYVETWQDRSGLVADVAIDDGLAVPQAMEIHLLRVVQEALGNVRKHAQARRARVEVRQRGEEVSVLVEDDGVGFDPQAPRRGEFPRFGLSTMRERAESAGGTMEVLSRPGNGTRVLVRFPASAGALRARQGA
jgi:signal transduction histidine kinase